MTTIKNVYHSGKHPNWSYSRDDALGNQKNSHKMSARANETLVLLELFSGSGSIGKAFRERGWQVISVDNDPRCDATIREDISAFSARDHNIEHVDCIWSSPPCTNYSVARRSAVTTAEDLESSDELVRKTLEIARDLGNPPLFVENPYTGGLRRRGLLDHLRMNVIDYCKYGTPYRKRTSIWTNTDWTPLRTLCKHNCASTRGGRHVARAQQGPPGPRFSQRELYRIPAQLCDEIAEYCNLRQNG